MELICNTADLTATQQELCREVPRAMVVLSDIIATFEDECRWQFKTSRWNCTGIEAPVYVDTALGGAFFHAIWRTALSLSIKHASCTNCNVRALPTQNMAS